VRSSPPLTVHSIYSSPWHEFFSIFYSQLLFVLCLHSYFCWTCTRSWAWIASSSVYRWASAASRGTVWCDSACPPPPSLSSPPTASATCLSLSYLRRPTSLSRFPLSSLHSVFGHCGHWAHNSWPLRDCAKWRLSVSD
jgi:hypothetical protein